MSDLAAGEPPRFAPAAVADSPTTESWSALGSNGAGYGALNSYVLALAVSGSDLYVGGAFTDAAGIEEADYVAKWNGSAWSALGSNGAGYGALDSRVYVLAVSGGDLYAGGWFTDAAGIATADHIAKWNGSAWSAMGSNGSGDGAFNDNVFALSVSGSDVYVGGAFTDAAGIATADYVAKWNGSAWSALGSNGTGGGALNDWVYALAVSGSDLYAGGYLTDAAGIATADHIAKWSGSAWSALGSNGSGDGALDEVVYVLAVSGSDLYVGGTFRDAAGIATADRIAKWNGSAWSALGSNGAGDGALGFVVSALTVSGSDLYVGGYFGDAAGIATADHIAKWSGSAWSALGSNGSGDGALDFVVWALAISGSDLYVGGAFTDAAGIAEADYVAKWGSGSALVPGAPTGVGATAGDASAVVAWSAPASNGGAAITGYAITSSPSGKTCTWTTGPLSCTVSGLTNETAYTFTVTATNVAGTGPASTASAAVTPRPTPGAPAAPTAVTAAATPSNGSTLHVTWTAPASDGGSSIIGYTATAAPGGTTCTTGGALGCDITALADGLYTVTVVATNGVGPGSPSGASAAARIDTTAPTATAPTSSLVTGSQLGTSTVPVRLAWGGADGGTGIGHYELAVSTNGGAYGLVASPTAASYTRSLAASSVTTYRFRVRALDPAGNASAWKYGPTFHVRRVQQSSLAVHYAGTWYTGSSIYASGGSYRYTRATGARATYTFTGRTVAVVAYKGTTLGSVRVYIDGVYRATVSDYATSTLWRRVVYSKTWSSSGTHTIRLVCVGTAGHPRIDLDAFIVLG